MNKDALFKHVAAMGYRATHDCPTPIPNCPQEDKPIRDRAWTDEQIRDRFEAWAYPRNIALARNESGYVDVRTDFMLAAFKAGINAAIGATP